MFNRGRLPPIPPSAGLHSPRVSAHSLKPQHNGSPISFDPCCLPFAGLDSGAFTCRSSRFGAAMSCGRVEANEFYTGPTELRPLCVWPTRGLESGTLVMASQPRDRAQSHRCAPTPTSKSPVSATSLAHLHTIPPRACTVPSPRSFASSGCLTPCCAHSRYVGGCLAKEYPGCCCVCHYLDGVGILYHWWGCYLRRETVPCMPSHGCVGETSVLGGRTFWRRAR